jgi:hypothetical protein
MIEVNGKTVNIEDVYTDVHGYLVLQKMPYENGVNYDVSYIKGLEMRALTDHSDNKFSNETYKANGQPTDLMLEYVRNIKNNSSIIWGDFKYNEGMWVKDDTEFEDHAYGFVPATFDSNIKGFAKFGFFNKGEI